MSHAVWPCWIIKREEWKANNLLWHLSLWYDYAGKQHFLMSWISLQLMPPVDIHPVFYFIWVHFLITFVLVLQSLHIQDVIFTILMLIISSVISVKMRSSDHWIKCPGMNTGAQNSPSPSGQISPSQKVFPTTVVSK